jgi:hypothetical protein
MLIMNLIRLSNKEFVILVMKDKKSGKIHDS